jgi:hypothetical protein
MWTSSILKILTGLQDEKGNKSGGLCLGYGASRPNENN